MEMHSWEAWDASDLKLKGLANGYIGLGRWKYRLNERFVVRPLHDHTPHASFRIDRRSRNAVPQE